MCHGYIPEQLGIPLNSETFDSMAPEEVAFWLGFLEEADKVVDQMLKDGITQPWTPPASFREKYRVAVEKYNGRNYCQVCQLEAIFSF